ncbi:MAG: hypothetical protein Q9170_006254 [Blastenia crenularia]
MSINAVNDLVNRARVDAANAGLKPYFPLGVATTRASFQSPRLWTRSPTPSRWATSKSSDYFMPGRGINPIAKSR